MLIERIKKMSVAWFSFNLATSAIALSSFALGKASHLGTLVDLSHAIAYLNTIIYLIISFFFIIKVALVRREFLEALKDPIKGPFITTISIATMLLALDWGVVIGDKAIGLAFLTLGAVLHTLFFIVIIYSFIVHEGIEVHLMNPGWYMPAVGNVLVPYIGSSLGLSGIKSLLGIYLGTGVIMWLALFTIWLYRSIFHNPPPSRLVPATWINFAPPAIAPMAYEMLLGLGPHEYHTVLKKAALEAATLSKYLTSFFDMFYYTFWGLAGLLFPVVLLVTIHYLKKKELRFAESWWAFVFPVAAYSISTIHLYLHHLNEVWLLYYASLLYVIAWFFYVITTAFSVIYGIEEWFGRSPPELARPLNVEGRVNE
ncbi:hypothetical protein IPA_06525 [Ignicoccus pacificus DSM 13166]|uniref:C4-dicarboxylate transporter/malic acid transport protein n=1 Tax=Ignicoccus pacificus DSM 13166 TaxID=940294 RepID=A0A977PL16_9CREN|nr:hypothetical protein IPA_06525 [Ignicoccus pacificus DSM 13166]